jgi:hypothetical protein
VGHEREDIRRPLASTPKDACSEREGGGRAENSDPMAGHMHLSEGLHAQLMAKLSEQM